MFQMKWYNILLQSKTIEHKKKLTKN